MMANHGRVVSIHVADGGAEPMKAVNEVVAVTGRGLQGDRYFNLCGTYSNHPGNGRHVTLIESDALEALQRDYEIALEPGLTRRNIVTFGVSLNHWVEREFRVGAAVLRGTRLCEPCAHLEKLTQSGTMRGLIHRGGLRAEIVAGGIICVGDEIGVSNDGIF